MIFLRYPLLRQGRVGEIDDFGSVPLDDEDEFGSVPIDAPTAPAPDPSIEQQRARRAELERVPDGMVDTGNVTRRRLILPETTFEAGGATTTSGNPATLEETREVRPTTAIEDFVEASRRYSPGALTSMLAPQVGLEAPSAQSAANALRANRPGESQSLFDRLSALIPTAPMAPGTESQSDERTRAMAAGFGTGNPLVGPWLDEMQGIADAATGGNYREGRDRARAQLGRVDQQARGASMVGAAAPNLALGLAGGPTAPTVLGRIGQAGAVGAGLGANQGAGSAEELADVPGDAVRDAAIGGATAAAMQGAGEGVARVPGLLARLFQRGADEAAPLAAADMLRARGLPVNAQPNTAYGRQVQRMGGEQELARLLDAEGVGGRFPTPNGSQQAAEDLLARGGSQIEGVHQAMAASGNGGEVDVRPTLQNLAALRDRLAATPTGPSLASSRRVDRQLIDPLLRSSVPENLDVTPEGAIADQVGRLRPEDAEPLTFDAAHQLRQEFDSMANWRNANPAQGSLMDAARDARGDLSSAMSQAAENLSPETRAAWQQGNQRYALGSMLRDYARPQGSQLPGAISEGLGIRALEGIPFVGRVLAGAVSNAGPAIRGRSLQTLIPVLRAMGNGAERFAPILEQSMRAGGPRALAITHYLLSSQQPQYRAAIERAQQEQQ